MDSNHILVVDDEIGIRELLGEILQDEGYRVAVAENANEARGLRNQARPRLVLLDIWMPDTDGVTLLKEWAANGQLTMPVVMMSGHATIDTAVEATRIGAVDFLEKPIGLQKLLSTVRRALTQTVNLPLAEHTLAPLGRSALIHTLQQQLDQIADLATPLLLLGGAGGGFAVCARYLLHPGQHWAQVDDQGQLTDSPQELLGRCSGGVLFLPELAHLSSKAQQALLQLLPKLEKQATRLVSASSRPFDELTAQLDPALLAQLAQLTLVVPRLEQHADDIPELAERLLAETVESLKLPTRRFSSAALNGLRQYSWPGNHEQLANLVKSLAMTSSGSEIDGEAVQRVLAQFRSSPLTAGQGGVSFDQPLREARDEFERNYLQHHIDREHGNMSKVAERVGLERTHLYRKLKQLGIEVARSRR